MKAKEFDKAFDDGGEIIDQLDLAKARRPEQEQKRVNVDRKNTPAPLKSRKSVAS